MNSKNKFAPLVALAITAIIWGATPAIMKLTLETVPVISLAFIRFFCASLLILIFIKPSLKVQKSDIPTLIFVGLAGITFHIAFFFAGLTLTSALNASLITASLPIVTILFAHVFLREKLSPKLLFGALVGIIGLFVIIGKDISAANLVASPLGDILILLSLISFVAYEVMSKNLFKKYHPSTVTFYAFLIGSVMFLPAVVVEYLKDPQWVFSLPTNAYLGILFGIVFASFLAYSFLEYGIQKTPISKASFFFYLEPIIGTICAIVFLGEQLTMPFIIGAVFIFVGLFLAEGHLPHHRPRHRLK